MRRHSIKFKLGLLVSVIILIITLTLTILSTVKSKNTAIKNSKAHLHTATENYAAQLEGNIEEAMDISRTLAHSLSGLQTSTDSLQLSREQVHQLFTKILQENPQFLGLGTAFEANAFDGKDAQYANTSKHDSTGLFLPYFTRNKAQKIVWEPLVYYTSDDTDYYHKPKKRMKEVLTDPAIFNIQEQRIPVVTTSVPVEKNGRFAGVVLADIGVQWIKKELQASKLFNDKHRLSVISNNGRFVAVSSSDTLTTKPIDRLLTNTDQLLRDLKARKQGEQIHNDTLRIYSPLHIGNSMENWLVMAEVPMNVILNEAQESMWSQIITGAILCLLALALTIYFLSQTLRPLDKMVSLTKNMAKGEVEESLDIKRKDEIGDMAQALKRLKDNLQITSEFASAIGQGNLESDYKPLSEHDKLGHSLLEMRDNLQEVKQEDRKRNWANQGLNKFAEILRNQHETLDELTHEVLSELVAYLEANQGALYIMEENQEGEPVLELKATYAWGRKKYRQKQLATGEGLAGQVVLEKDIIYLTEVPQDYLEITSGLGKANPSAVLIVPLMLNEEVFGVVELASFHAFEAHQINFLKKLAESLASTLSTVQTNLQTQRLLEKSKSSAEELQAIEEELRQNQEELEATQEEMARRMQRLKDENDLLKKQLKESN